jgi:hypothetical protein
MGSESSSGSLNPSSELMLEMAQQMNQGPEKIAWLESTIRQADLEQNQQVAFEARDEMIDAATWGGQAEKALLAFAWCLNHHDQQAPEARDWWQEQNLLWRYKWILGSLDNFPNIPHERIERLFQDFEQRLTQAGHGTRAVAHKRLNYAQHRGDRTEAAKQFERWQTTPRDSMADCNACEANEVVSYHIFLEQHEQALLAAKPLLEKRLTCHSVPTSTYASVLRPLLILGRLEEAARYHKLGSKISGDPDYLSSNADHLEFLALTGNLANAKRLVEKNLRIALETRELKEKFLFFAAMLTWTICLERAGQEQVNLNLTSSIPVATSENPRLQKAKAYRVDALKTWVESAANQLVVAFDANIGRPEFAKQLEESRQVLKYAVDYPLPSKADSGRTDSKQ